MAANQSLGSIAEIEGWGAVQDRSRPEKILSGLVNFARRKPLGFMCGIIVLFVSIIGDLVPVSANLAFSGARSVINMTTGVNIGGPKVSVQSATCKPIPCLAPHIAPFRYDQNHLRDRLQGHSGKYLLGTDELGRDILSRLLFGARVSVVVPFGAVLISELIGSSMGIGMAYYGGWTDKIGLQIVNVFQSLPALIVLITFFGIFGSGLWQLLLVIGCLQGPIGSRTIRGQVLSIMSTPYIESARVIGAGDRRIMLKYVLPNVFALIILGSTIRLGGVVLLEATLSFLGYGLPPPFPSWGQMLSLQGREYMRSAPGLAIYPGIAIGIIVFSYNLFGDALRDTLDPRLRGSR